MLQLSLSRWSIGLHAAYAAAHDAWMKNTSTGGYLMKMKIFFDKVRTSNHYTFHKLRLRFWWHRSPYLLGAWSKWSIILSLNQSRILLEAQTYFSDQFHFSGQCVFGDYSDGTPSSNDNLTTWTVCGSAGLRVEKSHSPGSKQAPLCLRTPVCTSSFIYRCYWLLLFVRVVSNWWVFRHASFSR